MSNRMFPQYSTMLFTDVWDTVEDFVQDYKNNGIPYQYSYVKDGDTVTVQTVSDVNIQTLFYLLYAKYGNSPLANRDVTQFKYKVFSIIYQYGPDWQKKLELQYKLRGLTEAEILKGSRAIYNAAVNPSTEPSTASNEELTYINQQNTTHLNRGLLEGYDMLLGMLETDVTESFLQRFNNCFKKFVSSERPLIYVTEEDEEDGD